jgi:hypothetical protein
MMVMAFDHSDRYAPQFMREYADHYRTNWPSPIVFHEMDDQQRQQILACDYDNMHMINTNEFRVFANPVYSNAYGLYKQHMPDFTSLHKVRKNAALNATENETMTDSMAFQGHMRILNAQGQLIEEIQGCGHHGYDYPGVASVRAGKGYKVNGPPSIQRII